MHRPPTSKLVVNAPSMLLIICNQGAGLPAVSVNALNLQRLLPHVEHLRIRAPSKDSASYRKIAIILISGEAWDLLLTLSDQQLSHQVSWAQPLAGGQWQGANAPESLHPDADCD